VWLDRATEPGTGVVVANTVAPPSARSLNVRQLMVIVASVAVHIATLRVCLMSDPFLGFGTLYSERYSESRFNSLRVRMGLGEVERIAGPPLRKIPGNQHTGPHDEEMWYYSDQPNDLANFHRRWVEFEKGKVSVIIKDFWID